jgi:ABC-2 type transport system ATP-binding protein
VTAPVIETRALRRQFGPTLAVAGLSLSVAPGEVFGFLGPNGAGKTTSIKMLLALIEPSGGTGQVLGQPLGDRLTRARIGFLPEHFRFHDVLTGREFLRFHGRLYGLRGADLDARIDALLVRVDLVDAADRPMRGYSKGMLQRAGLAQALINDPELVFLDEPTSGLDPLGRLLVRDIIGELRERGATVFLNSHLLGEVEATCDRVAFVKQGRVVHQLTLTQAPRGPAEAGLHVHATIDVEVRAQPIDACVIEGLSRFGTDVVRVSDDRLCLRVPSEEVVSDIVRWLVEHQAHVYGVQTRRKSLEQWFVEVMGDDQRPG